MKFALLFLLCLWFVLPDGISQNKSGPFVPGDPAPDILVDPVYGDSIRLSSLKGKKILLTFNRYVSCPLCNFRTHELLQHYDTLKKYGLVIVSVYESGKELLSSYASLESIPFIMVSDPDEKLYRKFKVRKSWWRSFRGLFNRYREKHSKGKSLFKSEYKRDGGLNRIGADFLIDENGIIRTAYYGKFAGDHLPVGEIIKWVLGPVK